MGLSTRRYPGLGLFRLVAAVMVVAIHTSPLYSISILGDFVLTRILCRVAVPFFFMCTGFFSLRDRQALLRFTRKTAALYGVAVILYLPLMWYGGYFTAGWPARLIGDVLWNGTFYHLWYFPAVLLGAWLTYGLLRLGRSAAMALACLLYIIGVLGNSWLALLPENSFFAPLLQLLGSTRNGVFFAPLFLCMGHRFTQSKARLPALCLAPAFTLLLAEGLLLRRFTTMRGDALYFTLPLVVAALFSLLVCARRPARHTQGLRQLSTWLYILHPWCIALVRAGAAKAGWPDMMETGSLLFFGITLLFSLVPAVLFSRPWLQPETPRVVAQIDLGAIQHNLLEMQALLPPGCQVMAVVKADAYGHGAAKVARRLQQNGVRHYAVATLAEGIQLRQAGIRGEILVFGCPPAEDAFLLWFWRLTASLASLAQAKALAQSPWPVRAHLKLDTGMHRWGLAWNDKETLRNIYGLRGLRIRGLYSHFSCADSLAGKDIAFTQMQIDRFLQTAEWLRGEGIKPGRLHIQSSYGVLNHPGLPMDLARIGLALYGEPQGAETLAKPALQPAMQLMARVASVQHHAAGEALGYGQAHLCKTDTRVANITLGYADGLPRNAQGASMLIRGQPAPILGRICMDSVSIDVSSIAGVHPGEWAHLPPVAQLAHNADTIPNELFVRVGTRVHRQYCN